MLFFVLYFYYILSHLEPSFPSSLNPLFPHARTHRRNPKIWDNYLLAPQSPPHSRRRTNLENKKHTRDKVIKFVIFSKLVIAFCCPFVIWVKDLQIETFIKKVTMLCIYVLFQ